VAMQRVHTLTVVALVAVLAALAAAQAFQWAPFEFPPGDQGSTVDVATVMRFEQEGVAAGDLGSAVFAGGDAFEARLVPLR
jgi:hypothetical protein